MSATPSPLRVFLLIALNAPVVYFIGTIFFDDWAAFFQAFIPDFFFGGTYLNADNFKMILYLLICAGLFYSEFNFFGPGKVSEDPQPQASLALTDRPNPSFNRTQPWVAASSFGHSDISSPLSTRLTVGSVNFVR